MQAALHADPIADAGVLATSPLPRTEPGASRYRLRLAASAGDVRSAQALRFRIFNLEMKEGLAESYATGLDEDAFDAVCDHLLVETTDGRVVGTYRLQSGAAALAGRGYYSEREFDLAPFEAQRDAILELGRACVHEAHRNFAVLAALWRGIAEYAAAHGARYLVGCSSLTTQDESIAAAADRELERFAAPLPWRTVPRAPYACNPAQVAATPPKIPRLLSAYLALGARICAPPAIDREFGTVDFLTWLDFASPGVDTFLKTGRIRIGSPG
jgi:putative hemolysin